LDELTKDEKGCNMAKTTAAASGQKPKDAKQVCFDLAELTKMYDFRGKTVAITGGSGVLGGEIVCALVGCGAKVATLDVNMEAGKALVERLGERGKQVSLFKCDVLNRESIVQAAQAVVKSLGKIDCLVNGAGGNKPQATTSAELKFFDLPADAVRWVFDLNVMGTILPSQVF
jgi:NAD(P)-dependent dehydrogenase (short-subunit alcohol dehydrogenase family)